MTFSGVKMCFEGPYFHEFLLDMPKADEVLARLDEEGILGGLKTSSGVLWCATEKASKADLDRTISIVTEVLA